MMEATAMEEEEEDIDSISSTTRVISLNVVGMVSQESCGRTVENALQGVVGVDMSYSSFAEQRAWAIIDYTKIRSFNDLIRCIGNVGLDASISDDFDDDFGDDFGGRNKHNTNVEQIVVVVLHVYQMMCQKSCGSAIENALLTVPGVVKCKTCFEKQEAWVIFEDNSKSKSESNSNSDSNSNGTSNSTDSTAATAETSSTPSIAQRLLDAIESVGFEACILLPTTFAGSTTKKKKNSTNMNSPTSDQKYLNNTGSTSNNETFAFQLGGMTCSVCIGRIERALLEVPGVQSAEITLATQRAQVQTKSHNKINIAQRSGFIQQCEKQVRSAGYSCQYLYEDYNENAKFTLQANAEMLERARLSELHSWRDLLCISIALAVPLFFLIRSNTSVHAVWKEYMICFLSTAVQVIVGWKYYRGAYNAGWDWGMDFLIVLGTTCSYLYSVILFIIHTGDPSHGIADGSIVNENIQLHPSFGTGAMLLTFVTFGKFLESYAKGKTTSALHMLCQLQPTLATKIINYDEYSTTTTWGALTTEEVSTWDIRVGDYLRVSPGARIPADGIIVAIGGGGGTLDTDANIVQEYLTLEEHHKQEEKQHQEQEKQVIHKQSEIQAIVQQETYVDESAFTGEPVPVLKGIGDTVYGSAVNQLSVLIIRVRATGADSTLAKIVQLMEDAQRNRAPIQAFADKVASYFVPTILILALLTFLMWQTLNSDAPNNQTRFFKAFMSAISVIVVACPCALGLATPTAVMVGTGLGATHGLLIKGGAILEEANHIDTVVFDKTGTCTTGKVVLGEYIQFFHIRDGVLTPKKKGAADGKRIDDNHGSELNLLVRNLPTCVDVNKNQLLIWLAACAEMQSEHPLSKAIVNAARSLWGSDISCSREGVQVTEFQVMPGAGVECCISKPSWGSWIVRVGNKQWTTQPVTSSNDIGVAEPDNTGDVEVTELRLLGHIAVYVSVAMVAATPINANEQQTQSPQSGLKERKRHVIGVLGMIDPIKSDSRSTVAALKQMGIDVWLCTGDHELTALAVAKNIGIDNDKVRAGMKPEDKAELVAYLQQENSGVVQRRRSSISSSLSNAADGEHRRQSGADDHGGCVAFVGDGINDAVALARANVGIAIGAGTEVAVAAADIVLVRSSLHDVIVSINLSQKVFQRIRINFIWAMMYNIIAVPFAGGVFYPLTNVTLSPEYAGLMMALSSVSVVASSLLLRTYRKPVILEDGTFQQRRRGTGMHSGTGLCSCFYCLCGNRNKHLKDIDHEIIFSIDPALFSGPEYRTVASKSTVTSPTHGSAASLSRDSTVFDIV